MMNVIPESGYQSSVSTEKNASITSNAVQSLPDTLRQQEGGAVPLSTQLNDRHPLEHRVRNWEETQRQRQLEQYRQIFGISEPMKRVMELEIVQGTDFSPLADVVGNHSSIHQDILLNKDASIDWEDIYPGISLEDGIMLGGDVHTKMEKQLGI